jgi:hypothetical protein
LFVVTFTSLEVPCQGDYIATNESLIPSNIKEVLGLLDLKLQCKEKNHMCLATSQTSSFGGDLGGVGGLVKL